MAGVWITGKPEVNFPMADHTAGIILAIEGGISSQDLLSYDITPDGQRFLIATKIENTARAPLSVTLNWTSGLDK